MTQNRTLRIIFLIIFYIIVFFAFLGVNLHLSTDENEKITALSKFSVLSSEEKSHIIIKSALQGLASILAPLVIYYLFIKSKKDNKP